MTARRIEALRAELTLAHCAYQNARCPDCRAVVAEFERLVRADEREAQHRPAVSPAAAAVLGWPCGGVEL